VDENYLIELENQNELKTVVDKLESSENVI
jgi:hypothetical protein